MSKNTRTPEEAELHTRIVDILGDCWETYGALDFYLMADALIRELQLRQIRRYGYHRVTGEWTPN